MSGTSHLHGLGFDNVLGVIDLSRAHYDAVGARRAGPGEAGPGTNDGVGADNGVGVAAARLQPLNFVAGVVSAGTLILLLFHWASFRRPLSAERLAVLVATLLAATAVVFVVVQVVPGDPVRYMMGLQADPASVAAMRHQLGLDAAPLQRYLHWIAGLLHGDFGRSYTYRIPVGELIAERLQVSLPLAMYALLLSTALAFPVGLAGRGAARPRNRYAVDRASRSWAWRCPISGWACCWCCCSRSGLHWVSAGGFPGLGRRIWPASRR